MKRILLLTSLLLVGATQAFADQLLSSYSYSVTEDVGTSFIRDLEFKMDGHYSNADGGWGVSTSYWNNLTDSGAGSNANTLGLEIPFGPGLHPVLDRSIFFGIMQGLPQDIADNNPDQKHLVLFVDPTSASNIQNIAFGTVFPTTNEDQLIDAIEKVHNDTLTDDEKKPYYENYIYPFWSAAENANAGSGSDPVRSVYFSAGSDFDIMLFSDGQKIGSGTSSVNVVPEPATCTILGIAALGLMRRRK